MPNNGFSESRDVTLSFVSGSKGVLSFNLITEFSSQPITEEFKSNGLDGVNRNATFERGWRGQFTIERRNQALDLYFAAKEDDYYLGRIRQECHITELIQEADGSITRWRYTGVVLRLNDAGNWRSGSTVKQSVSFVADRRLLQN